MIFKSRGFPVLLSPRAKAQKIIHRKSFHLFKYFLTAKKLEITPKIIPDNKIIAKI